MASSPIRSAFITGASSGIGAALARTLAADGITVALAARRESALRTLADEIEQAGGTASVHPLDVSDPAQTVATVQRVDDELGGLDLVVANAGVAHGRWSGALRWDDCATMIAVNVAGATATLTALIPRMAARKRGHLVGISSIAGVRGMPRLSVYGATKAYLSNLLEGLRIDLSRTGVRVTDIRPGYVHTEMSPDNGKMPFAITADDASQRIWKAIRGGKEVLTFPLPMAGAASLVQVLPNALYDAAMRPKPRRGS